MHKNALFIMFIIFLFSLAIWLGYQMTRSHADIQTIQDFQLQRTKQLAELQTLPLAAPNTCQDVDISVFKRVCENQVSENTPKLLWSKDLKDEEKICVRDTFFYLFQRLAQLQRQTYQPSQQLADNQLPVFACKLHSDLNLFIKEIDMANENSDAVKAIEAWYKYKLIQ